MKNLGGGAKVLRYVCLNCFHDKNCNTKIGDVQRKLMEVYKKKNEIIHQFKMLNGKLS